MEKKVDVLGRYNFIEKIVTLVETIAESKRGTCFALDGAWGSGKSFVLERLENRLRNQLTEANEDNKYYIFHYDCWKYDYYEEPAVAIIAAMLDDTDKELALFSEGVETAMTTSLKFTRKLLGAVASELCKNKIGIDLVEIASEVVEEQGEVNPDGFDSLYGFKRALENTRKNIQEIAKDKKVVIVVDELDRCLPEYAIRVLERLHHIFVDLENVIVIISMDKKQLGHSIKGIYGDIEVDAYLRKFISFKVNLDIGIADKFFNKYTSYTEMFEFAEDEIWRIETFLTDIMQGIDIRKQEYIFEKAEIIHRVIADSTVRDGSIMTFEILYLTLSYMTKSKYVNWIFFECDPTEKDDSLPVKVWKYEKQLSGNGHKYNGLSCVKEDEWLDKTFYWMANLYYKYEKGRCGSYYYNKNVVNEVEFVHRFEELMDIIDYD